MRRGSALLGKGWTRAPDRGSGVKLEATETETPWRIEDPDLNAWSVSDDGMMIHHHRKQPDIALLDMELTEGTHTFSFRVKRSHNNKGHHIFIGVLDSAAPRSGGDKNSCAAGRSWCWHPYDGHVSSTPRRTERRSRPPMRIAWDVPWSAPQRKRFARSPWRHSGGVLPDRRVGMLPSRAVLLHCTDPSVEQCVQKGGSS